MYEREMDGEVLIWALQKSFLVGHPDVIECDMSAFEECYLVSTLNVT